MQIKKGFYYHYKYDPTGAINNYAYEVLGVGCHTEKDEASPDKYVVVYRPLYEGYVYRNDKMFDIRPLEMFLQQVEVKGSVVPRFRVVEDEGVLVELRKLREEMYG